MPAPTETKYSTTSIFRMPRSGKYGFSGVDTRTSCRAISRTTASLLLATGAPSVSGCPVCWESAGRGAGLPVRGNGEVDQVGVHGRRHARRLRVGGMPLALPGQQHVVLQILRHVLGARVRRHRVAGVADDEDRGGGVDAVALRQRRPVGLP